MVRKEPQRKPGEPARILIVDDHPLIRQGLILLLRTQRGLEVCGEADDAMSAMSAAESLEPDLVILDLSLGYTNGIDLIKDLRSRFPQLRILVLSMHDEAFYAERALRAGAGGYVMKGGPLEDVVLAVEKVLEGKVFVSEKMASQLMNRLVSDKSTQRDCSVAALSDRELRVMEMIGEGLGTGQIARNLNLSVKTIETHRARIKDKLRLKDATALRQYAIQWLRTRY